MSCKFLVSSIFVLSLKSVLAIPCNNVTSVDTTPVNTPVDTTPVGSCAWIGHCLGDTCASEDDCDNDWVCTGGVCSVNNENAPPVNTPVNTGNGTTGNGTTGNGTTGNGTIVNNVYITFYGFDDNDNGSGQFGVSTISNPVIHQVATETSGTFNNPSTFASDEMFRVFGVGSIIYVPKYRKYYILEDTCVECTADQNNGNTHIDLYIGGNTQLEGSPLINCENTLTTGGFVDTVILNPPNNLPVDTVVLYDPTTQVCNTQTFPV
jgi:3D (Asp-Asp-Asp) domain-containing protein